MKYLPLIQILMPANFGQTMVVKAQHQALASQSAHQESIQA
jgi:hypothetical protein